MRAMLAVGFVVALIGIVGCGGDDDGGGGTTAAATTTEATTTTDENTTQAAETLDVSLRDFEIVPPKPSIKAGPAQFRVENNGGTPHNLEVEGPKGEVVLPSNLNPGQTGTLNVDLSEPGKYVWYCPVGEHRDFGMEGEITVTR